MICGGLRTKGITKKSSENNPLISVVTVVYNGVQNLENTILSVINQNYSNIEYIIVDGNSNDGTVDVIKKYEDQIDYWQSEPDTGIYDAMNKGISLAKGDYVAMMNSGDSYVPNIMKTVVESINLHPDSIMHGIIKCYKNSTFTHVEGKNYLDLPYGMIAHPTVFTPVELHKKYGGYDKNLKIAADYDFFLKMFYNKEKFYFMDFIVANFDYSGISNTSNLVFEECDLIRKRYGFYVKPGLKRRIILKIKKILRW